MASKEDQANEWVKVEAISKERHKRVSNISKRIRDLINGNPSRSGNNFEHTLLLDSTSSHISNLNCDVNLVCYSAEYKGVMKPEKNQEETAVTLGIVTRCSLGTKVSSYLSIKRGETQSPYAIGEGGIFKFDSDGGGEFTTYYFRDQDAPGAYDLARERAIEDRDSFDYYADIIEKYLGAIDQGVLLPDSPPTSSN